MLGIGSQILSALALSAGPILSAMSSYLLCLLCLTALLEQTKQPQ